MKLFKLLILLLLIGCSNPNRNPAIQITAFVTAIPCTFITGLGNECYELNYYIMNEDYNYDELENR